MTYLTLDKKIYSKCNKAIVISGSARSGTTILGKIIHSFDNVEYSFEPPMLYSLFALVNTIPESQWKLLYETFLYEEFLINAIAGRGLNCNRSDDSSIYKVKPIKLIEKRLESSLGKNEIEQMIQSVSIAYKMPDIVPFLPQLITYYPQKTIIIITRNAYDVFNSILEKKWFSSNTLRSKNLTWPNRFFNGIRIPFWVHTDDAEKWYEMNELHRIAYYYLRVNQPLDKISGYIKVRYDDLISDPIAVTKQLSKKLSLNYGEKTLHLISTVSRTNKDRDYNILNKLDSEVRKQVEYYSELS